jgi:hypothetical protein
MFNIFKKQKTKIKVVGDQDLIPYIKSLGLYEDIEKGKILCKFCGKKIDFDNLQAIFPCEKKICFAYSNAKCLSKLYDN